VLVANVAGRGVDVNHRMGVSFSLLMGKRVVRTASTEATVVVSIGNRD